MIAKFEILPDTQNGLVHQLVVQAENEIEQVALHLWADSFFDDFVPKNPSKLRAILLIKSRPFKLQEPLVESA